MSKNLFLKAAALLSLTCAASYAATLEVGSEKIPSLQAALNEALSGDTVLVYPGTYAPVSVSEKDNITLIGIDMPKIVPSNSEEDQNAIGIINSSGWTISGFETAQTFRGIFLQNCSDMIITNNYMHDHTEQYNNGIDHGIGLCVFQSDNITAKNNIVANVAYVGIYFGADNSLIQNNTIYGTQGYEALALLGDAVPEWGSANNVDVINNIFLSNAKAIINKGGQEQNGTVQYNLIYDCPILFQDGILDETTLINQDPLCVNPAEGYFSLMAESPAIAAGKPDAFGRASDIGAVPYKKEVIDTLPDPKNRDLEVGVDKEFKTIQAAVDVAISGDTVTVFPGTYSPVYAKGVDNILLRGRLFPTITLGDLTIDTAAIKVVDGKNWTISGFVTEKTFHGISLERCSTMTVQYNITHDHNELTATHNGVNHGIGIAVFHSDDIMLSRNIVYDNRYVGIYFGATNSLIINNTIQGTDQYEGLSILGYAPNEGLSGPADNVDIIANIIINNPKAVIYKWGQKQNGRLQYNLAYNSDLCQDCIFDQTNITGKKPLFTDALNGDFSLLPASPAIAAAPLADGGRADVGAVAYSGVVPIEKKEILSGANADNHLYLNHATLTLNHSGKEAGTLALFDLRGRMLFQQNIAANESSIKLPTTQLGQGIYMIKALIGTTEFTQPFVIK